MKVQSSCPTRGERAIKPANAVAVVAVAALKDLGSDPANRLRELGIRGTRGCADCPIVQYLWVSTGREWLVFGANAVSGTTWIPLPMPISRFIARFDQGSYPDLQEEQD